MKRSRLSTSLEQSSEGNDLITAGQFDAILFNLRLEAASISCAHLRTLMASSSVLKDASST